MQTWKVFKESHMDTHKEIVQALHATALALKVVSLIARNFIFSGEALKVIIVCVFFVHNSLLAASRISFSSLISVINLF